LQNLRAESVGGCEKVWQQVRGRKHKTEDFTKGMERKGVVGWLRGPSMEGLHAVALGPMLQFRMEG